MLRSLKCRIPQISEKKKAFLKKKSKLSTVHKPSHCEPLSKPKGWRGWGRVQTTWTNEVRGSYI